MTNYHLNDINLFVYCYCIGYLFHEYYHFFLYKNLSEKLLNEYLYEIYQMLLKNEEEKEENNDELLKNILSL